MKSSAVLLLFLAAAAAAKLKPLSTYFTVCKWSLPNDQLEACVKNTVEKSRPRLIKGIPELGLLPIDPMRVDKIAMKDDNGRFKLSQTLTDLSIYGMGNYTIKDVSMDKEKFVINMTVFIPKMRFESAYEIDGQILVVPITGSGRATFNFTDTTMKNVAQFKIVKKGNKDFIKIDKYKLRIEPKGAQLHFTNLFNGDKRLGDATNKLLNDNWQEAFDTYRQLPEEAFGKMTALMSSKFFTHYPLEELFPQ